jgi:scyllo-inositol 2-dehydrogenase (NADP+)
MRNASILLALAGASYPHSMSNTPVRTAVIGFGLAGKVFHCPFVSAVPGLELSAIVQRSGDTAAQAYPSARILRTPEEAFVDPAIDLVVIGTPNDTHTALATAALQGGKHVVVDKPITGTAEEAQALIQLAAARKLVLAPFHNRRFDGDFLTVKKILAEGTLGRVVTVVSRFDRFRPLQRPNTWKEAGDRATGLLVDLGPHVVDGALALFGAPARIAASVRRDRDITDIDDAFDIYLDYDLPNGHSLRYTCGATMLAADPAPRFQVHGTRGSYTKYGVDPQEPALLNGAKVPPLGSPEPWLPEPESAWGHLTTAFNPGQPTELQRIPYATVPGDYRLFYASVRDAILGTAPLAISAEDGYRTIRLLDLARQSAAEGRTLPVTF